MEWSDLPAELLGQIYPKLASVVEFVRFRAVCRSWRSAASPSGLPPQLPWLLLPYDPLAEARPFLCLSTGTVHVIRLPETRNQQICGSGHGWLILFDRDTTVVTLLNPLTGSRISLPPLDIPIRRLLTASLSANPTSAGGCVVAICASCTATMAFCWLSPSGSTNWSMLQMKIRSWATWTAYHNHKLCTSNARDTLYVWDTTPQEPLTPPDLCVKVPSLGEGWILHHFLLVDSCEEFLVVAAYGSTGGPGPINRRDCSVVYKLDSATHQLTQLVSENIGDGVRRLNDGPLVHISTGKYVLCKKCLYFARYAVNHATQNVDAIIKVLDLEKRDMEEFRLQSDCLPSSVGEVAWLVPSLI